MARLIYASLCSLDGYVADEAGTFGWAMPDAEVHAFVNDLERSIGTHLYGRRLYETMAAWETMDDPAPVMQDYAAIWRGSDKVVYSRTLDAVTTERTRLEPELDLDAVRALKATAERDVAIGGPTLAAHAIRAGLVDDYHLTISPVVVGGGTRALPDGARLDLELAGERRFANGALSLHYRPRST